eukprot:scaffold8296_cov18-Prasinocladus_malaysianus.AAC.2
MLLNCAMRLRVAVNGVLPDGYKACFERPQPPTAFFSITCCLLAVAADLVTCWVSVLSNFNMQINFDTHE